jgi:hypothetical protein
VEGVRSLRAVAVELRADKLANPTEYLAPSSITADETAHLEHPAIVMALSPHLLQRTGGPNPVSKC